MAKVHKVIFSVFIVITTFSPVTFAGTVAVPHRDTTLEELKSIDSFVSSALPVLQDGFFIGTSSGPVLVKSEPDQRFVKRPNKRPSVKPGYYNTLPRLIPKGFEGIAVSHFNLGAANPYQPIASSKSLQTVPAVISPQQYVQPVQQTEQYAVAQQVYRPQQYVTGAQQPQQYNSQYFHRNEQRSQQQFVQAEQSQQQFVQQHQPQQPFPQPEQSQQQFLQPEQPQQQQFFQPEQPQQQQFLQPEQPQPQQFFQPEQPQQQFFQPEQPEQQFLQPEQQQQQQFLQPEQQQQQFLQPEQSQQRQQLYRFPQQYVATSPQFIAEQTAADSQQAAQEPTQISARSQPPISVAEPSFQVDNLLRSEQEPASVTTFQTQVFGRERFQSQKLLRNEAVVATTEFEETLPEDLRNRFYKNANLATILAQESLPIQGEQIISEWDTNKIAKGKIHALLSGAGLI